MDCSMLMGNFGINSQHWCESLSLMFYEMFSTQ